MFGDATNYDVPIVATTGMVSRELWEARLRDGKVPASCRDFLTIGGMGHAISIATSIARNHFPRKVLCLDGDGSLLMHTGSLLYAARQRNLIHVVVDNGVHDSVGGQETGFRSVDAARLSQAFGYVGYSEAHTLEEYENALSDALDSDGSYFIRAFCSPGSRENLGRPKTKPIAEKNRFIRFLSEAQSNE
jgi:phosphonopyruvate decarboxylase